MPARPAERRYRAASDELERADIPLWDRSQSGALARRDRCDPGRAISLRLSGARMLLLQIFGREHDGGCSHSTEAFKVADMFYGEARRPDSHKLKNETEKAMERSEQSENKLPVKLGVTVSG